MYCLTILEVRSTRPRCGQDWVLLRTEKESLFQASPIASGGFLAVFGAPWRVDLCLHLHVVYSLYAFTLSSLCVCPSVCEFPLFKNILLEYS